MKKLFLALIFGLISTFIYAAPFGLKMGMTVEEIAEQCEEEPSFLEKDIYLIKPSKNHPLFQYYAVYVNDKTGLYQIRAVSDYITCNQYGTELQNAFNSLKDRIGKTYGKPRINNKVDPNISEFSRDDKHWFMTLKEGSRVLAAIWGEKTSLLDDLSIVGLECVADSGYLDGKGHLLLYYVFNNATSVEDEQDSVF